MATKAERYRAEQQRTGDKKTAKPKRPRGGQGVASGKATAGRNRSTHAAKKATYALEDSATGKPSRRSTRSSANRAKPGSNLTRQKQREVRSPEAQAERAKVRAPRPR